MRDKEKQRATQARYREKNREKLREYHCAWRAARAAELDGYNKRYYEANRDRIKERARARYETHGEVIRAQGKARRLRDPEAHYTRKRARLLTRLQDPAQAAAHRTDHRERLRQWREQNPEEAREQVRRRNALKRAARGTHTTEQWLARVSVFGWRCAYCRRELTPKTLTQDHAIPVSRGGSEWPSNLRPACLSCNSRKHKRTVKEYVQR